MLSELESANDPLVFLQVEEQEDAERFFDECGEETICELLNFSDLTIIWRFGANNT
jgi:hypothetical protein